MTSSTRKPFVVWVLLPSGEVWLFERHHHLAAALRTARTLCGPTAYRRERVWIAAHAAPAHRRLVQA